VESLERFDQNQRIIQEFTAQWLATVPSELGRLVNVALLRDVSSGRYRHPSLERTYSETAVHQALHFCHEKLFEKVLEASLQQQELDLRTWFAGMDVPPAEIAGRWLELEFFRVLVPFGTPAYLRDLLFSNLRVILTLVIAEQPHAMAAS
jgi:hypothetical protein